MTRSVEVRASHAVGMAAEYTRGALRHQRQRINWMRLARVAKGWGDAPDIVKTCVEAARTHGWSVVQHVGFVRRMVP